MNGLKRVIAGVGLMICGTIAVCTIGMSGLFFIGGIIFFFIGLILLITGFSED